MELSIPDQEATIFTITANNQDFTAVIEDNDTAKAFFAILPLSDSGEIASALGSGDIIVTFSSMSIN